MQSVRMTEDSLAPGTQELAVMVKHHHRMFAAIECINIVVPIYSDRGDLEKRPALRQFCPVLNHLVAILTGADNYRHDDSLLRTSIIRRPIDDSQSGAPFGCRAPGSTLPRA